MPLSLTYPGVYVEELPSGSRTITGVSTSVTAFVGRCLKGPVNEPVVINSFADFERLFGGLWLQSNLSFAVRDFYLNGGSQAVIVRIYNAPETGSSKAAISLSGTALTDNIDLQAVNEGSWANSLAVTITHDTPQEVASLYNLTMDDFFTLTIYDGKSNEKKVVEILANLTVRNSTRRIDKVLQHESNYLRVASTTTLPQTAGRPNVIATPSDLSPGSDGDALLDTDITGSESNKTGLYALEKTDIFNLLCIPPYYDTNSALDDGKFAALVSLLNAAAAYCAKRRAFLIVDAPKNWKKPADIINNDTSAAGRGLIKISSGLGSNTHNAAIYFPYFKSPNPLRNNQIEEFAPCGVIAGTIARIDAQRGIWKAPAGIEANLAGVVGLSTSFNDAENGQVNPLGVNCLRAMPAAGPVIWGARTLKGNDQLSSEWKYIPVRRLALYIEESLYRGMQWAVFEPNDEPLWRQLSLNVDSFMNRLFRQGAFQGSTAKDAYFVKCNKETTTQNDIDNGIVNILVGFAPLKPAEFVVIKLQQIAGQPQA